MNLWYLCAFFSVTKQPAICKIKVQTWRRFLEKWRIFFAHAYPSAPAPQLHILRCDTFQTKSIVQLILTKQLVSNRTCNQRYTKRNNLDTLSVFIEFLKYVENSSVVLYRGYISFKVASNSEGHLTADDTEGVLTVIYNDILAEPNDLGTEFDRVRSYNFQRIFIQKAVFMPKVQKNIKQKEY